MSGGFDPRLAPLILSLGLDTFALSIALGIAPLSLRVRLRLAVTFAFFEGLMPAVGLLVGRPLGQAVGAWAVYLAAVLLIGTGLWMLREALTEGKDDEDDDAQGESAALVRAAASRGLPLVGIALSVSMDELAVGFSFGVLRVPVVPALIAIALQALLVSLGGLWLGRRAGRALGERAELAAGIVLCLLGVALVVLRLTGIMDT